MTGANLEALMEMLASQDGLIRKQARETLVALGLPAVVSLIDALQDSRSDQLRWEAVKALGEIGDARSIPVLVKSLADNNTDVQWVAAVALSKFGLAAWPQLLQALVQDAKSFGALRQGTHHVLRNQHVDGFNDLLAALLQALESSEAPESAISIAHEILKRLQVRR